MSYGQAFDASGFVVQFGNHCSPSLSQAQPSGDSNRGLGITAWPQICPLMFCSKESCTGGTFSIYLSDENSTCLASFALLSEELFCIVQLQISPAPPSHHWSPLLEHLPSDRIMSHRSPYIPCCFCLIPQNRLQNKAAKLATLQQTGQRQ